MTLRFRSALAALFVASVVVACGPDKPPQTAASANTSSAKAGAGWSFASFNNAGKCTITPGKVVLVDIWATWCEPCKKSFPKLQELHVKYKTAGLDIVALSGDDDKDAIPDFAKNYGAKFPVCWDEKKDVIKKYDPKTMPSSYILDKKGNVKFTHTGWHDGEEAELEKEIRSLL